MREEPSAGPHSRAAGAGLPAVMDTDGRHLRRLAGPVQPLEHDEGAALRHKGLVMDGLLLPSESGAKSTHEPKIEPGPTADCTRGLGRVDGGADGLAGEGHPRHHGRPRRTLG